MAPCDAQARRPSRCISAPSLLLPFSLNAAEHMHMSMSVPNTWAVPGQSAQFFRIGNNSKRFLAFGSVEQIHSSNMKPRRATCGDGGRVAMVAPIVGVAHGPCYPLGDKPNRICILSPIHTEARRLNSMCTRLNDTPSRNRFICGRPMHQGLGPSSVSTTTCKFSEIRQGKALLHTTSDRYAVHNYNLLQLSFATPRGSNKNNVGKVRFCLLASTSFKCNIIMIRMS